MVLKYDVYVILEEEIKIIQLIPQKKEWIIKIPKEEIESVKQYVYTLEIGQTNIEYEMKLENASPFIKELDAFLKKKKLVSEYESADNSMLYSHRQLEVFDSWNRTSNSPIEYQRRIENSNVLVVGAGGVGSAVVNMLISCGVGKVYVADFDKVTEGNLARQFLYGEEDVGRLKVEVLSERLNKRGLGKVYGIDECITEDNIENILSQISDKIDVITGLPTPNGKNMVELYKKIISLNIPIICTGEHDAGPMFISEEMINAYMLSINETFLLQNQYDIKRSHHNIINRHPSYLPEIGIMTSICVDEIIRYISQYAKVRSLEGYFGLDPITYQVKYYNIKENSIEDNKMES